MTTRRDFLKIAGLLVILGPDLADGRIRAGDGSLRRPALIIDQARCLGCQACAIACYNQAPGAYRLRVALKEEGGYPQARPVFEHLVCRQCRQPLCRPACPQGALEKRAGVVVVNEKRCRGLGHCLKACPFPGGLIIKDRRARKCSLCLDLVGQGLVPACVEVCPSGARIFGDLLNPSGALLGLLANKDVARTLADHLQIEIPEGRFSPKVYSLWPKHRRRDLPLGGHHRLVHTVCLACNARCGLRVWAAGERVVKIEGNPYHPYNRRGRPIDYHTPLKEALQETASTCGKPQCDQDYLENPYRLRVPLKRNGPRGSGRFVPISWEQLIREVAEGGRLFAHLGEDRHVPGLREILSDEPISPQAPELGPRRNQLVWITGRSQAGRKHFIKRFVCQSVGSTNYIGHTDICGLGFRMGNWAFTGQKEVELKADLWNARYILIFGSNIYAALQPGVNTAGATLAERAAKGDLKYVIIDPRAHEAVAQAHHWLPVRPGKDGALAMGIMHVLLKDGLYDREFLSLTNQRAAAKKGRNVFSNATYLVITTPEHPAWGRFIRAKDIGPPPGNENDPLVISASGRVVPANQTDRGLLEWQGEITLKDGSRVKAKTAFSILKEEVLSRSLSFYARESGVAASKIRQVAREFAEHAPQSAAFAYHGGGNYVGGTYASYAIALLNALVGNINLRGGYLPAGGGAGPWRKGRYDLRSFPGAIRPQGVKISRERAAYEKSREFKEKGYPSKLPWFAFTKGGLSASAMAGIEARYPYPIKILFTYFFNPVYSIPGGKRFEETLASPEKVPLHVSIDVTINESNIYADYIVPDVTYLEGHYGFLTPHAPAQKFTAVRTPVVAARTGQTDDGRPFCLETFLIDLAEYLKLPGFGPRAIADSRGGLHPLHQAEDFYLRGVVNLAEGLGIPPASPEERAYVEANYPVAAHRRILSSEEWARCCSILARGGVFLPPEAAFDEGGNLKRGIPQVFIWNEDLATSRNSLNGKPFWGTARYQSAHLADGRLVEEVDASYPLVLITHKMALHTQSRTICYRRALELLPEPRVLLNPQDAGGLKSGQWVRLISASNPRGLKARVELSERVRPGCLVVPHHFGHWQHGASELEIERGQEALLGGKDLVFGSKVRADKSRARGISPNLLARLDESLDNLPLVDPLGGIPDFSSTRVAILKEERP